MAVGIAVVGVHRLRVRQVETQFAAVLDERSRMSRELHDTLAQGFAGIAIHLDAAAACLPKGERELRGHLAQARELVRESLAEARRAVLDLRPRALEQADLVAALSEMPGRLAGNSAIRVEVGRRAAPASGRRGGPPAAHRPGSGDERAPPLRGARRSASAWNSAADKVSLRIQDDGHGFAADVAAPATHGHLGLVGIRERTSQIRGHFTLHSAAGAGTELLVEVPVPGVPARPRAGEGRTH